MTDDSLEIPESLDFHPCNTPRGCTYYNTEILTECQQFHLNDVKLKVIKSDERYLLRHPEIRGFIMLILRHIYKLKPRRNIPGVISEYFRKSRDEIEVQLDEYVQSRPPMPTEEYEREEGKESVYGDILEKFIESLKASMGDGEEEMTRGEFSLHKSESQEYIKSLLIGSIYQMHSGQEVTSQVPGFKRAPSTVFSHLRRAFHRGGRKKSRSSSVKFLRGKMVAPTSLIFTPDSSINEEHDGEYYYGQDDEELTGEEGNDYARFANNVKFRRKSEDKSLKEHISKVNDNNNNNNSSRKSMMKTNITPDNELF